MFPSMILGLLLSLIVFHSALASESYTLNATNSANEFDLQDLSSSDFSIEPTEDAEQEIITAYHLDSSIAWGLDRRSWTQTVRAIVKERFTEFHQASDANYFCPGYAKSTREEQENCFVALVAAIAKFECNFRPELTFREPNGRYSVGLLMLSPGECGNAPTKEKLKNPIQNLICGTNKMAKLISRDNIISGSRGNYGAAAYWSTLRKPYRSGKYKLGKRDLIQRITKNFRSPQKLQAELDFLEGSGYIEPHGSLGEKED